MHFSDYCIITYSMDPTARSAFFNNLSDAEQDELIRSREELEEVALLSLSNQVEILRNNIRARSVIQN